ncbi:hypothetical protein BJ170DRAFT_147480 [Xylariales sp. AK1849]|nr:hypothetical protein BJ170DRAFT_147480 [Xylariales sp. AK1849]
MWVSFSRRLFLARFPRRVSFSIMGSTLHQSSIEAKTYDTQAIIVVCGRDWIQQPVCPILHPTPSGRHWTGLALVNNSSLWHNKKAGEYVIVLQRGNTTTRLDHQSCEQLHRFISLCSRNMRIQLIKMGSLRGISASSDLGPQTSQH